MTIATYTPPVIEMKEIQVQEAQITLNLSIDQAKVIYAGICNTNGRLSWDLYKDLKDILQQSGTDISGLDDCAKNGIIDVQGKGL